MSEVPSYGYKRRYAVVEVIPLDLGAKLNHVCFSYADAHNKAVELSKKKPGVMFRIYEMLCTVETFVETHTQTRESL